MSGVLFSDPRKVDGFPEFSQGLVCFGIETTVDSDELALSKRSIDGRRPLRTQTGLNLPTEIGPSVRGIYLVKGHPLLEVSQ